MIEKWQCVLVAFSKVTGIAIDEFIRRLGHDGSEIVDPSMHEPLCRRGFACQEILSVLPEYGWVGTRLDLATRNLEYGRMESRYHYSLNYKTNGVMYLKRRMHAVAWINGQMEDMFGVIEPDSEIISYVPLFRIDGFTSCQNQINFETVPKIF